MKERDKIFLQRAVDLAAEGIHKGGGPFGAVISKKGEIISEAYNEVVYTNDPTAHAEILAIRKACQITGNHSLEGCSIYTSCEPCPMCLGAIYWSGIEEVIYAAGRNDAAAAGFGDEKFYEEIMKEPQNRKIKFRKLEEVDGTEVFRIWDRYENKIPY